MIETSGRGMRNGDKVTGEDYRVPWWWPAATVFVAAVIVTVLVILLVAVRIGLSADAAGVGGLVSAPSSSFYVGVGVLAVICWMSLTGALIRVLLPRWAMRHSASTDAQNLHDVSVTAPLKPLPSRHDST